MGSRLASDKFNIETPSPRRLRRRIVKSEPETCDLNEDGGHRKRKNDEDLSVSDMTLKELKERCKKKKKLLNTAGLRKQTTNTSSCFETNQEYASVEIKEEESDLETPIITWKRRDSCKAKSKHKCIRKQVCLSLDSGISVEVINEQIHSGSEYSLTSLTDKHDPPNIKIEILEPDCVDHQNGACLANGSASEAIEGSSRAFSDETPRSVSGAEMVNLESSSFIMDSPRYVNEASFNFVELCEPISLCLTETVNSGETKETGFPQPISLSPVYELTVQGNVGYPCPDQNSEDPIPVTQDQGSDILESCEANLCQPHISFHMDCVTGIECLGTEIGDDFRCKDLNFGGSSCVSDVKGEVDSDGDSPTHHKGNRTGNYRGLHKSFGDPYKPSKAHFGIDPVNDDSPLAEKHSICITGEDLSAGADREVECLSMTSPNATDGFIARELFESQNGAQPDCPPKKLLSTRKEISPTSQEQLLQFMDIEELHDSAGKSGSDLLGTMATIVPGEADAKSKKSWNDLPQFVPKGILKASHGSLLTPLDGNENFDATRSQKAVAFSQRQMQDIESLALKLMEELKSMKDIVKESLSAKEYSPTPPKYTADEMRAALQNAVEVEETTKKWLSMMARDCNRFCKIMRSGRKKTAAERKKITFADQAGGRLCHVKILEECPDSGLVPESEDVHMDV